MQIGLSHRATFGDHRHVIIYGQRTADGRFAFGGRGAPYHLGSKIRPEFDREPTVFHALRSAYLARCSPFSATPRSRTPGAARSACRGTGARPRGWTARTGLGWAGGYVGDGVATTNLAGRTLADLIAGP